MKVFIVSQAGKVADVTLQSSCYAEDESVIKVSTQIIAYATILSFKVFYKLLQLQKNLIGNLQIIQMYYTHIAAFLVFVDYHSPCH